MKLKSRSRLFYKWVISYIIILIIPICIATALLFNMQKIIVDVYKVTNHALYQQIGEMIDNQISELDKVRNLILSNTELAYFCNLMPETAKDNWYNLVKIQKQISTYATSYNANKFYVYLGNIDSVLTPNGLYSKELAFSTYHTKNSIEIDKWFDYINQYHARTIQVIKNKDSNNCTAIISSIPNLGIYRPRAVIVQILEEDILSGFIKNIVIDDYTELMLVDSNDNIIISNSEISTQSTVKYDLLQGSSGHLELEFGGEKKLVLYQASSIPEWKYVTMISKKGINDKIYEMKLYTIAFLIFSIVVGYILSYFAACYNYNPVRGIINRITPYIGNNVNKQEYDQIESAFDNILEEKDHIYTLWKKQTVIMRSNFIESMLKGQVSDSEEICEIIKSFDIHFKSDMFCVMILCAEAGEGMNIEINSGYMHSLFMNIEETIKNEIDLEISMYPVEIDSLMAILVNFDESYTEESYHSMCNHVLNLVTSYKEQIFVTASKVYSGLATVYLAYSEAMEGMNYKLFSYRDNPSSIIHLKVEPSSDRRYIYTVSQEYQLINKLRSGNTAGSIKLFNEICQNNFVQNRISFNMMRCLFYDIIGSVFKVIDKQDGLNTYIQKDIDEFLDELNKAESSKEMWKITECILVYITENVQKSHHKLPLSEEIIRCVNEHFHESDFNVSKVAQYLSMNMSYISKYFKDNTGIGLLEYINRIRINHAKDLLLNSDISVSKVSTKVGFENINSFIRVFKKYEGITPGLYQTKNET